MPITHNGCASYTCITCGQTMEVSSRNFRSVCPGCGNTKDFDRDHEGAGLTPIRCEVHALVIAGRPTKACLMKYACYVCRKEWTDRPSAELHCTVGSPTPVFIRQYPPINDGNYARKAYCRCSELSDAQLLDT